MLKLTIPEATALVRNPVLAPHNNNINASQKVSGDDSSICNEGLFAGLINDMDKIITCSGLVPRHFAALQKVATETGYIIAFRPVEPSATWYIEQCYPTKNYHIKGKSSNFGPMAGLIPVNQSLSKLEKAAASEVEKYQQEVQECLDKKWAFAGPLRLSAERVKCLLESGLIEMQGDKNHKVLYARGPSDRTYQFKARLDDEGNVVTVSHNGKRVDVLYDFISDLPFTSDYDLMLVGPPIEQYGPEDMSPVNESWEHFNERTSRNKERKPSPPLQELWPSREVFYRDVDKNMGNVTPRVRRLIEQLNEAMDCDPGREVVHHSDDARNTEAKPGSNYPTTIILPYPLDWVKETILLAEDKDALARIIKAGKEAGFYMPLNDSNWEAEITRVRRPSFEVAHEFLAKNLLLEAPDSKFSVSEISRVENDNKQSVL